MDWLAIISPAAVLGVLGVLFGGLLGVASKKFAVEVDETVAKSPAVSAGSRSVLRLRLSRLRRLCRGGGT